MTVPIYFSVIDQARVRHAELIEYIQSRGYKAIADRMQACSGCEIECPGLTACLSMTAQSAPALGHRHLVHPSPQYHAQQDATAESLPASDIDQAQGRESIVEHHRAALRGYIKATVTNTNTSATFEQDGRRKEEARLLFEAARRDLRASLTGSQGFLESSGAEGHENPALR
jgi:hypothetical protein